MRLLFLIAIFQLLAPGIPRAQSLVGNGGFERLTQCPGYVGDIHCAVGWVNGGVTPDLFSACTNGQENGLNVPANYMGTQRPVDGQCYAGLVLFTQKEYISAKQSFGVTESMWTPLTGPLRPGNTYRVRLWLALADSSLFTSPYLTVLLSQSPFDRIGKGEVGQAVRLNAAAVDTAWQEVTATFTATDRWAYASLGLSRSVFTFKDYTARVAHKRAGRAQHTYGDAYYYVDKVELTEVGP